jgi:hypothetical protein
MSIWDDSDHWRERAREARAIADATDNPIVQRSMLRLAEQYDLLVKNAEEAVAALDNKS